MLTPTTFNNLLATNKTLLLDGALASELELRGHDLNHALWSGKVLLESPSSISRLHKDYNLSGAHIATTATYQTSTQGLTEHLNLSVREADDLMSSSVRFAQAARDEARASSNFDQNRPLLIAGSVGPYGAYLANGAEYTGDYGPDISKEKLKSFHRPRIQALVSSGVDLLAVETLPHFGEVVAVLELLAGEFPSEAVAWVSCSLLDGSRICDGTRLEEVYGAVVKHNRRTKGQVVAFGINCVPPGRALEACELLAGLQRDQSEESRVPLLCYPNSGEGWDGEKKVWVSGAEEVEKLGPSELARKLRGLGVRLIGGCCRTGPKYIEDIASALREGS